MRWGLFILLLMLVGCKSPTHIVETVHETQFVNRVDSVFVDRWHSAERRHDTLYLHDSVWYSKTRILRDSIMIHDTLTIEKAATAKKKSLGITTRDKIVILAVLALIALAIFKETINKVRHGIIQKMGRNPYRKGPPGNGV